MKWLSRHFYSMTRLQKKGQAATNPTASVSIDVLQMNMSSSNPTQTGEISPRQNAFSGDRDTQEFGVV